ncbi:MAG TPA: peptide chain release factor N(5)-glutamine methyltransferase [Flavobacteriaceae bacterium]|nr:peptide chain release factor N(5)-glutamine methyltransferase [Flavobacteriaceae bacterium]
MIVKEILNIFHKELDTLYGKDEVDSFFNLLLEFYLDLNRIDLVLNPNLAITKTEEQPLFEALSRLKLEEPIQYILGETEFYGLKFKVNKHTLIPRPETEELVNWILEQVTSNNNQLSILDIGTGSGCIAISLAKNLPNAKVYAMDISKEALKIAKENAEINGVEVEFIHQDILGVNQNEIDSISQKFDIIVSNPPYVRHLEKNEMKKNVLDYEPHLALFVQDNEPLLFYKAIAQFAVKNLKPNGQLFFEINQYLGKEMIELLQELDFKEIKLKQDLFGNDRMIKAVYNKQYNND